MPLPQTEITASHGALDYLDADVAVRVMLEGQLSAIASIQLVRPHLLAGAALMAEAISAGGALIYAAAGSSGLMALADASELAGTFGITSEQVEIHMAGGVPADGKMSGHSEDEAANINFSAKDVLIVLSASGTTPYALAVAAQARASGAKVIAIANNYGAPLLLEADVAIHLNTPCEVIAGSTRLGAGTAQKVALNVMSTMMGVQLGHVYRGLMVNLIADNDKLKSRAQNIVCDAAEVTSEVADAAILQAGGQVKLAILIAAGRNRADAQTVLKQHNGQLGPCLKSNQTN